MAEKMFKLVIKVDLSCHHCYRKIQKTLCKLQERGENIKTISYDEKNNTVTVYGPFDPQKLSKKIRCKACKVIIEIITVDCTPPPTPPKRPPTPTPPPPPPPPPSCCKVINDIQIILCGQCKDPNCPDSTLVKETEKPSAEKTKDVDTASKKDSKKKKEETTKKEPCKVINDIDIVVCGHPKDPKCPDPPPPCYPNPVPCPPPVRPDCCWKPCYGECHGGSRCCSCRMVCGCSGGGPPAVCGGTSRGGYQLICEDPSTSCTIM